MKILPATDESVLEAAAAIRRGDLVVIPTETVYGLAADASNPKAIAKVFAAKGRPAENPLIVHIAGISHLTKVARTVPQAAKTLADAFWPGPLTLVLPKLAFIPSEVTAGLDNVAVRMPNHITALQLIAEVGRPLAAPSANRFTRLSPTRIEHLDPQLMEHVAFAIDAGPCQIGVESTVLDLTCEQPRILRPGGVSRTQIEQVLRSRVEIGPIQAHRSPGMYSRHYSPNATVNLVEAAGPKVAALVFGAPKNPDQIRMPSDPQAYAANLYEALHFLDSRKPGVIEIELPPEAPEWEAVLDRLAKAAG